MKVSEFGVKSENEQFSKFKKVKVKIFAGLQSKIGLQGDVKVWEAGGSQSGDWRSPVVGSRLN